MRREGRGSCVSTAWRGEGRGGEHEGGGARGAAVALVASLAGRRGSRRREPPCGTGLWHRTSARLLGGAGGGRATRAQATRCG